MRLIDADALMENVCGNCQGYDCAPDATDTVYGCELAEIINQMPTIEPEVRQPTVSTEPDRKLGHWIMMDADRAKCSLCGWWLKSNGKDKTGKGLIFSACYHYCTACGARMDGGAENEIC